MAGKDDPATTRRPCPTASRPCRPDSTGLHAARPRGAHVDAHPGPLPSVTRPVGRLPRGTEIMPTARRMESPLSRGNLVNHCPSRHNRKVGIRAGRAESPTRCPDDNEGRSACAVASRPRAWLLHAWSSHLRLVTASGGEWFVGVRRRFSPRAQCHPAATSPRSSVQARQRVRRRRRRSMSPTGTPSSAFRSLGPFTVGQPAAIRGSSNGRRVRAR